VCPFVPTSLKKNSIYMSVIRTSSLVDREAIGQDKEEIVRKILVKLLQDFVPVFLALEPNKGKLRQVRKSKGSERSKLHSADIND